MAACSGSLDTPGPGYPAYSSMGSSFRPKSAHNGFGTEARGLRFAANEGVPGPGEYKTIDTTFGRQTSSKVQTTPCFGFGSSDRVDHERLFVSNALSKVSGSSFGQSSPGPQYDAVSAFARQPLTSGRSGSAWRFGT
ncbi:MAG: hypothetical protein SGPRY_003781, partial [Prymnesium sp.]